MKEIQELIEKKVKELTDKYGLDCPSCPNQGWYSGTDFSHQQEIQVQCEFCYREPKSRFNLMNDISSSLQEVYNNGFMNKEELNEAIFNRGVKKAIDNCVEICDKEDEWLKTQMSKFMDVPSKRVTIYKIKSQLQKLIEAK